MGGSVAACILQTVVLKASRLCKHAIGCGRSFEGEEGIFVIIT